MNATEAGKRPKPENAEPLAVQVLELTTGTEFIVFFAPLEADLPGDGVRRELRIAARLARNVPTRGIAESLINDGIAGIIGAGASAGLASAFTATTAWLRRFGKDREVNDVQTVMARLKTASEQILGTAPSSVDEATIKQRADGQWHAAFVYRNFNVTATLNSAGSVVTWKQVPRTQP